MARRGEAEVGIQDDGCCCCRGVASLFSFSVVSRPRCEAAPAVGPPLVPLGAVVTHQPPPTTTNGRRCSNLRFSADMGPTPAKSRAHLFIHCYPLPLTLRLLQPSSTCDICSDLDFCQPTHRASLNNVVYNYN